MLVFARCGPGSNSAPRFGSDPGTRDDGAIHVQNHRSFHGTSHEERGHPPADRSMPHVHSTAAGDFLGEECLTGQRIRKGKATAIARRAILMVGKASMLRLLRTDPAFADRFMAHLLSRNARVEDDLMDRLQSSAEQRLARTLLILAGYGHPGTRKRIVPWTSRTTLAEIVGRARAHESIACWPWPRLDRAEPSHRKSTASVDKAISA